MVFIPYCLLSFVTVIHYSVALLAPLDLTTEMMLDTG